MNFLEELLKQRMAEAQVVSTGVMQPDMAAHSSIDNIIGQNQLTMSQMPEPTVVGGGGMGSLVDMMSPMKAATLIPAGSQKAIDMLNEFTKYRRGLNTQKKFAKDMVEGMKKQGVKETDLVSGNVMKGQQKRLNKLVEDSMVAQSVNQAIKQYNMFGAARPGTERFIQTLLESLGR